MSLKEWIRHMLFLNEDSPILLIILTWIFIVITILYVINIL